MLRQLIHFQEGEVHPVSRVLISIKQQGCSGLHLLQHGFLCWTRPLNTSSLLGTLADLTRGNLNLSPKMRSSVSNSSCFVDRANNQCAPRGIEACWCFWQERRGSGGKRSWGGPTFVEWENLEAHPFCCCS